MPGKFQIKLEGAWNDYCDQEDKILKRAFMAGHPKTKFTLRNQQYVYNFKRMVQINERTNKEREIRPPNKWKAPKAPIVPPGPTTVVTVPAGSQGTTIQVPHPKVPGAFIAVTVPAGAKAGQAMLVPVPDVLQASAAAFVPGRPAKEPKKPAVELAETPDEKKKGYSTGAKVAIGAGGAVLAGGAVAGALLGAHAVEHGTEATGAMVEGAITDAGEAIEVAAVDAGDFIVDASEDIGDFIMDLF